MPILEPCPLDPGYSAAVHWRFGRKIVLLAVIVAGAAALFQELADVFFGANLHTVRRGIAYRSAQLAPWELEAVVARHGIRTHHALKALHLDHLFGSKAGGCVPGAEIEVLPSRFPASERWNANKKLGQSVAYRAIDRAIELADQYGIAQIAVDNAFHYLWGGGYVLEAAQRGYYAWLKTKYGFTDAQTRPYTFNIQPFVADKNVVQQGYLTSEPFAVQKAGVKANTILLADNGYPSYATTISCMDKTVKERSKAVDGFVKATAEGWKSYLADPAPANALIKKDNPQMSDDLLAYGVRKMLSHGIVAGGGAAKDGLLSMSDARWNATIEFIKKAGISRPNTDYSKAWSLEIVNNVKVTP